MNQVNLQHAYQLQKHSPDNMIFNNALAYTVQEILDEFMQNLNRVEQ